DALHVHTPLYAHRASALASAYSLTPPGALSGALPIPMSLICVLSLVELAASAHVSWAQTVTMRHPQE
ncbi:MAG: hypothetical protein AB3X46_07960, partial [Leptothrix ochracea]|uniref:hypothetical protein n=1 Tax=Leptothrix ochracea TaxID=735331 RepID=UPI0034E27AC6